MENVIDINNAKVKTFIESQIRPGEKYDYKIIQNRFDKVLAKEENKELRKFRLILEGINKNYKSLIESKNFKVSQWYVDRLRKFIIEYKKQRQLIKKPVITWEYLYQKYKANKDSVTGTPNVITPTFSYFSHDNRNTVATYTNSRLRSSKKLQRYTNRHPNLIARGKSVRYGVDEFGCVLVCE